MADRILISRGTPPVKLAKGKSVKVPATKDQAYQIVDLAAPAGNAPADPAKLTKEGGDLVMKYPDGTQLTLGNFFEVCPGNACTVTIADGTATGQVVSAGAIGATGGLGFWAWTGIIGGGGALAVALSDDGGDPPAAGSTVADLGPGLTGHTPADGASGIAANSNIILDFDENVVAGTGNIVIRNGDGSDTRTIPIGDPQVTISGTRVTINPALDLQPNSDYTVEMASGVLKGQDGVAFAGITGTQLNFATEDTTNPTLVTRFPLDNAPSVAVDANIVLTFSKSVKQGTGNIVISDGAGDDRVIAIGDTSQVTISGNTVTINPAADLHGNSHYSVQIASGVITDLAGRPFTGITSATALDFDTQDLMAPTLVGSTPADNATAVAIGNSIVLTFSEAVVAGSGNIVISNGSDVKTILVTDTTQVTVSGNTVTINPASDLQPNSTYNVQMTSGVLKDASGNAYAGLTSTTALSFDTQDTIVPTLQGSTPADGATAVLIGSDIVLTFSENVRAGTGNIVISNGSDAQTISVTDTAQVTFSSNTITINPTANLNGNNHYTVQMESGVILDASGNAFAGLFGSELGFTTSGPVELFAIAAGVGGFAINGQSASEFSGFRVAGVSDVNGDGLADIIIGAGESDPVAGVNAGRAYVVFGKSAGAEVNLGDVARNPGAGGYVINGQGGNNNFGQSVSGVGDFNLDGLADVIVGAPYAQGLSNFQSGRSYVLRGKTDTGEITVGGGGIYNGEARDDFSGSDVSGAGDVNGDGYSDVIVGARGGDPAAGQDAGRCYVVFGGSDSFWFKNLSSVTSGSGGFVINGQEIYDSIGYDVSGAGDINGDGLADLIVSSTFNANRTGRTYVVFGKSDGSPVDLVGVAAGAGGFAISGESANTNSGISVSSVGDVNGDGLADLIVGAPNVDTAAGINVGRSYVVFGKSSGVQVALSAVAMGSGGFAINGHSQYDASGSSVSGIGDINGDGLADLLIGVANADSPAGGDAGLSYVVFGKAGGTPINLSAVAAGSGGFVINGGVLNEQSGYSVSGAGDVNGDGLADLIVGAYNSTSSAGLSSGRSYVIFGSTAGAFSQSVVDQYGTPDADSFTDSGSAKTLVTGAGDDSLEATAASVLYGGAGNDRFAIDAGMITALQSVFGAGGNSDRLSRIDGGTGIDTLALSGSGLALDLTQIANQAASNHEGGSRIDSIERIDLTGIGNNSVMLQLRDVLDMGSANTFDLNGRKQILITGNTGDSVDLADATGTTGWTQSPGTVSINSVTYNVWNHNTALATIYVATPLAVI